MVAAFLEVVGEEFGPVDRLAVFAKPFADAVQHTGAGLGDDAVGGGADIEQEIAVPLCATGEHVEDLRLGFPFVVAGMEAPAFIHRHAGFPWAPRIRRAEVLLGRGEVARQAIAAVEENVRLDLADHGVHLFGLPSPGVERPPAVIPEDVDRIVAGDQLPDALVGRLDESIVGDGILQRGDGIGLIIPVVETVVEADLESVLPCGGNDLGNQIAPCGTAVADMEIGKLRRIEAESLMVHCREHYISHAGIHRHAAEPVGVEILRGEPGGELLVFLKGDFLPVPNPLRAL